MRKDWIIVSCPTCGGHGLREGFGGEFIECRTCGGIGGLYLSPHDRVADYPGGPFRGSWPGEYARIQAAKERA